MRALSEVQCLCKQSARNDMILQCSSLNVIFELSSVQFKMVYIYIYIYEGSGIYAFRPVFRTFSRCCF